MAEYQVFVDGAEGTTGLRIRERLSLRDDVEMLTLSEARRKNLDSRLEAVHKADLTILCLPDAAAREIVNAAHPTARICDTSTAHRTSPGWLYGFPELDARRAALPNARRVAVPGCHATGFLALAVPLLRAGVLSRESSLTCHSITGYSGGGKKMIADYETGKLSAEFAAPRLYGLNMAHKHLPEMQAISQLSAPPLFCPVVANYYSGMLVSLPISAEMLATPQRNIAALADIFHKTYADEPLITVHNPGDAPADGTLSPLTMSGRDSLEIYITGNETQFLLCARFDNLGKGASGAAVQCMNAMLGLPETTGLVL